MDAEQHITKGRQMCLTLNIRLYRGAVISLRALRYKPKLVVSILRFLDFRIDTYSAPPSFPKLKKTHLLA